MPRTVFRLSDKIRQEVVCQYTTPLPDGTWKGCKLIARELGIADTSVINILREQGVRIRTAREAHSNGKQCSPVKHTEQLETPPLCACGCGRFVHWIRSQYRWSKYVAGHYRKEAPYKSRDWLLEQYVTLRRDVDSIARECGVNISSIIKFMNKFGIERRDARESHIGTQAGAKNPAWKGGTTPERQRLYKTQEWKALIKSVYARDNYVCQRCKQGVSGKGMRQAAAHHIKSWADYPALRFELSNLITLCRACHVWVHSLENATRDFLD